MPARTAVEPIRSPAARARGHSFPGLSQLDGGTGDCELRAHVGSVATAGGGALDQQSVGGVSVSGTMLVGNTDR